MRDWRVPYLHFWRRAVSRRIVSPTRGCIAATRRKGLTVGHVGIQAFLLVTFPSTILLHKYHNISCDFSILWRYRNIEISNEFSSQKWVFDDRGFYLTRTGIKGCRILYWIEIWNQTARQIYRPGDIIRRSSDTRKEKCQCRSHHYDKLPLFWYHFTCLCLRA